MRRQIASARLIDSSPYLSLRWRIPPKPTFYPDAVVLFGVRSAAVSSLLRFLEEFTQPVNPGIGPGAPAGPREAAAPAVLRRATVERTVGLTLIEAGRSRATSPGSRRS
jgi:hypothetical protein